MWQGRYNLFLSILLPQVHQLKHQLTRTNHPQLSRYPQCHSIKDLLSLHKFLLWWVLWYEIIAVIIWWVLWYEIIAVDTRCVLWQFWFNQINLFKAKFIFFLISDLVNKSVLFSLSHPFLYRSRIFYSKKKHICIKNISWSINTNSSSI